ncbi:MAG: protein-glutamate O-methyltransferase CheR [Hyphomicrobiales bacterium]
MTPQCFEFFSEFLHKNSGLSLQKEKEYLLENRLDAVLKKHKIGSFEQLMSVVKNESNGPIGFDVIDCMSVTETSFFRDRKPFDLLVDTMLPEILGNRLATQPIRIWSAAASSGQEAYTIAMLCKENPGLFAGRRVEIHATDISDTVLAKAKSGLYSQFEVQRGLPTDMMLRYFEQVGEMWTLTPEIKSMVKFKQFNLMHPFTSMPKFDIIFCRNVLIYFDAATKSKVFEKLHSVMADDGYLLLGGAETTMGLSQDLRADADHRTLFRSNKYNAPKKALSA